MGQRIRLIHGDCLEQLRTLADNSVHAVVTDPPYGLSFMGKKWDYDVPSEDVWRECLRVLKPGGHLLAFAGTRTQHRMAVRIEDAGFEIRDMIAWVYGSGFPKSLDVSKAIDKAAGVERKITGINPNFCKGRKDSIRTDNGIYGGAGPDKGKFITAPATEEAKKWHGWGTALKPALEPITVARKPLIGTVAENVLTHGTGAINVDGCRVETSDELARRPSPVHDTAAGFGKGMAMGGRGHDAGRWPANLIHDGSEEPTDLLGSAARFFYCAKASKADRGSDNRHPTVKPTELMRYLVKLVTPPDGIVLDPFMGSGSTGKACAIEGFQFIGIEREEEYMAIAESRIRAASNLFSCQ